MALLWRMASWVFSLPGEVRTGRMGALLNA